MTKLTVPLFRSNSMKIVKFNNYKKLHPFKVMLPPVLKNHVQNVDLLGKGDLCMDEMSTLMACWRDHEFAVDKCAKEIAKFQNCVTMAADDHQKLQTKLKSGKVKVKGHYNTEVVNEMLKKFPTPPHTLKPK